MDGAREPLHILLVDDDPRIRAGMVEMLGDAGHVVTEAGSGAEALAILADDPAIGLMITDNRMPGITGAELIARARRDTPTLPILLITGYDSRGDDIAPDIALLTKPFREARLLEAVQRLSLSSWNWSG
jgi:CheY-like chemotaxis protein